MSLNKKNLVNLVNVVFFAVYMRIFCSRVFLRGKRKMKREGNRGGEFSWASVDLRHVTNRSRSFIYVDLFATAATP